MPWDAFVHVRAVAPGTNAAQALARRAAGTPVSALLQALQRDADSEHAVAVDVQVIPPQKSIFARAQAPDPRQLSIPVLLDGQLLPFRVSRIRITPHALLRSVDVVNFAM
jgi:hypothetical protein